MRPMSAPACSIVVICALLVSVVGLRPGVAHAERTVNDCFAVSQSEREAGVEFELANSCDRSISCQMNWRLQCESASGKVASQSEARATVLLAAGERNKLFGSATACKDHPAWTIEAVRFACAPVR